MNTLSEKPLVIGIGELLWDLLPTGKKAGGAPINFAYHASQMGANSYAISAVGKDLLGNELMEEMDKIKINHLIEKVNFPTGTVLVELKEGIPNYTITENVAWDHTPMTHQIEDLAKKADAICFGTLAQRSDRSRNTIELVLSAAKETAYRIFDINIRQNFYSKAIITNSLRMCNVLKLNEEELILLKELFNKQQQSENEVCNWCVKEFHLKFMILTAGSRYSKVFTPETFSHIPTPQVKVVDTVGAGDAFTGAFIASILKNETWREAHQKAVERAAFVCTQSGAWSSE